MITQQEIITHKPRKKGRHKIFIGMAAGVGKTFRMLEEGHQLKAEGIDVVVGLLETHKRKETEEKAHGLEIIPRQQIERGGIILTEMDTEAILTRQPQLALIDELAHTNIPGCKYEKRYEDVEEILAAGIDVYSTVNIQHIESLNDIVAKITGVIVRERIPDKILDQADEVVVVDVTPETLEERLLEGKIYAPDKIQSALNNFFQRRHLIALRELALREIADSLEEDAIKSIDNDKFCTVHERVMVCVSTYPNSIQLLRRGARIADHMRAKLYILFVGHPEKFLSKEESLHIETCEKLTQQFGGEFVRVTSSDVPQAIAETAKKYHITQVVLGHSQKSRWQLFFQGSFIHKLLKYLNNVDLHIIANQN